MTGFTKFVIVAGLSMIAICTTTSAFAATPTNSFTVSAVIQASCLASVVPVENRAGQPTVSGTPFTVEVDCTTSSQPSEKAAADPARAVVPAPQIIIRDGSSGTVSAEAPDSRESAREEGSPALSGEVAPAREQAAEPQGAPEAMDMECVTVSY